MKDKLLNKDISIYIGIPFCIKPCSYCHYKPNIVFGLDSIPQEYLNILIDQIKCFLVKNNLQDRTLLSCYFGGGTPSLLSVNQIKSIINVFSTFGISFCEKSIEIHPCYFDRTILELGFFNRFSIGVQTTLIKKLEFWRRDIYQESRIQEIYNAIKESNEKNIINFDFVFENSIPDEDLKYVTKFQPDTVVFYPLTGQRSEIEAAKTLASLKKAEMFFKPEKYYRKNDYGFHFFKDVKYLSKYAEGEYSFSTDIIGFGHNSVSRIGNKSFLSRFDQETGEWYFIDRERDVHFEVLYSTIPFGVNLKQVEFLPQEIQDILVEDKHFFMKYLPIERKKWLEFFRYIQNFSKEKRAFCWRSFFWADSREKSIDLFFESLEKEYSEIYLNNKLGCANVRKRIPDVNILIEGIDGSGKDTFAVMLIEFLKQFSLKEAGRSISLVGLPSSNSRYGNICKQFVEEGTTDLSYEEICACLFENREDFCKSLNIKHPGMHIFVRSVLTEQGTLSCLFNQHKVQIDNYGATFIDMCIIVRADISIARERISRRGIKETWRESEQFLRYFDAFFLQKAYLFPNVSIIDNSEESFEELRYKAFNTALEIYEKYYE